MISRPPIGGGHLPCDDELDRRLTDTSVARHLTRTDKSASRCSPHPTHVLKRAAVEHRSSLIGTAHVRGDARTERCGTGGVLTRRTRATGDRDVSGSVRRIPKLMHDEVHQLSDAEVTAALGC